MATLIDYSANLFNLFILPLKHPAAISSIAIGKKKVILQEHTIHKCIIHNHQHQIASQDRFPFVFIFP